LLRQGKDTEAEKDFERAIMLDPALKTKLELGIERVKKWRQTNRWIGDSPRLRQDG
jgi:hypothetical protein